MRGLILLTVVILYIIYQNGTTKRTGELVEYDPELADLHKQVRKAEQGGITSMGTPLSDLED